MIYPRYLPKKNLHHPPETILAIMSEGAPCQMVVIPGHGGRGASTFMRREGVFALLSSADLLVLPGHSAQSAKKDVDSLETRRPR